MNISIGISGTININIISSTIRIWVYVYIYIYIYMYTHMCVRILRRYGSLTHFSPVVVKSVCGGYLACGLSVGLRCGYPPPLDTYLVKGCPGA